VRKKTHCVKGHRLSPENLCASGRKCRKCYNAWCRDAYWNRKVAKEDKS